MIDSVQGMNDLPQGTVTFLFTDIEGSTQLLQQLREKYTSLLADHHRILRTAIAHWHGKEVDTQGDAFFVAFPRASDAIAAVLEAQQSVAAHRWPDGLDVRVRMGLHTGEARVTQAGYVGMDVHRAARICATGYGGQVLLSPSTYALIESDLPEGIRLRDLGEHRLKDLQHPLHLYQLIIPGLPADFPILRSLSARPNNLPMQLTSFVGRQQESDRIKELLGQARLVTIVGPGGAGKSRLSLQVAADLVDQFPQGVWFVKLGPLASAEEIVPAIAHALHFRIDAHSSNLDPTNQLLDYLSGRSLLLVLDNFEHLLEHAGLLTEMLLRAPQVKVLLTSRERLNLAEEWVYTLNGMSFPQSDSTQNYDTYSAMALFVERARQSNPAFSLAPEAVASASRICRLVAGMPLALELAAPWTAILSYGEIADEIEHNLDFLTNTLRGIPEGHRSLRAVFDYSCRLLNEDQRAALRNLSIFQSEFDRQAAQRVAGVQLSLLMELVNKSLVQRTDQGRFQMHALLHQFAAEQLNLHPTDQSAMREKHSRHYIGRLETWQTSAPGTDWQAALEKVMLEGGHMRAALRWALLYWDEREARKALENASHYYMAQGMFEAATAYQGLTVFLQENGASLAPGGSMQCLLLNTMAHQAMYCASLGDATVEAIARECLEVLRGLDLELERGLCLYTLGLLEETRGNYQDAIQLLTEASQLLTESRGVEMRAGSLLWLGWAYYEAGHYTDAEKFFNQAYQLSSQQGVGLMRSYALSKLGTFADATGNFAQGLKYHQEALQSFEQLGDQAGQGYALIRMCHSACGLGNYEVAEQYGRTGYEHFKAIGHRWGIATGLCRIGFAALGSGKLAGARDLFVQGLQRALEYKYRATAMYAVIGLASLWAREASSEKAVEALTLALADPITPALYKDIATKELSLLQGVLAPDAYSAAQARGQAMKFEMLVSELIQ